LLNGNDLIILPSFNLEILSKLGDIIDTHSVTFMSSVPAVWRIATRLSKKPLNSSLKRIHCGSAPLGSNLVEEIKNWSSISKIYNVYGITEFGSWIGSSSLEENKNKCDGFIGKPWGAEFLITKEDNEQIIFQKTSQTLCEADEVGYIWVRTPALMKEYYKNADTTREFVFGSWFFTGDKGFLDNSGNLVLKGRVRNEINKGGIKVMPEDIDIQLEKNSSVLEACTFGVHDEIAGQEVNTAIVIEKGGNLEDIKKWLRERISAYKFPSRWFVLDTIPKTDRGKINRSMVAEHCYKEDAL
jgi:acyl-CoA synthetase (AMP-forming)/AMP-acid ligase II